jgi:hypothetical protein
LRQIFARLFAASILLVSSHCLADPPDPKRTYNPAVTQETIQQTICVKGWTDTVRPPFYITQVIKKRLLIAQGMTWDRHGDFELDHVVPLCAGGELGDLEHTSNFQLQINKEAKRKERLERKIGCLICTGQVTLADGRAAFEDWQSSYGKYALIKCRRKKTLAQ